MTKAKDMGGRRFTVEYGGNTTEGRSYRSFVRVYGEAIGAQTSRVRALKVGDVAAFGKAPGLSHSLTVTRTK